MLSTGKPASSHIIGDHAYAVVGYNASSSKPFEVFNPWGADASGRVPGYHQAYGLFSAHRSVYLAQLRGPEHRLSRLASAPKWVARKG